MLACCLGSRHAAAVCTRRAPNQNSLARNYLPTPPPPTHPHPHTQPRLHGRTCTCRSATRCRPRSLLRWAGSCGRSWSRRQRSSGAQGNSELAAYLFSLASSRGPAAADVAAGIGADKIEYHIAATVTTHESRQGAQRAGMVQQQQQQVGSQGGGGQTAGATAGMHGVSRRPWGARAALEHSRPGSLSG